MPAVRWLLIFGMGGWEWEKRMQEDGMRFDHGVESVSARPGCSAFPLCPHCGDCLLAPEASELIDHEEIRHTWICESCGGALQTSVSLPALVPSESPDLVPE
jgi:hypothetical protein